VSLYRVKGKQRFLGHAPETLFVGELAPAVEARAVKRGTIEDVESGPLRLDITRATLPRGWADPEAERSQ
jgi:hypothetical protein